MSSFFTTPSSQKKRKLKPSTSSADGPASKRRNTTHPPTKSNSQKPKSSQRARDDSISGSGSDDDEGANKRLDPAGPSHSEVEESSSDDETAAEKRLRLAEQYLQSIKGTVDETGFDAEDLDRDLIAERLQEDVAETKGRLHRHIASTLDFPAAVKTQFRGSEKGLSMTGIAICEPFVYTVAKDMALVKWRLPEPSSAAKGSSKKQTKNKQKELVERQESINGAASEQQQKKKKMTQKPIRRRPVRLLITRGYKTQATDQGTMHHTGAILCIAASPTGQFVATGGADRKLIIWSAADLKPLRVFTQHRDAITGLAFRRGTNQLYSSSKDRTIKSWSLNELAYVETLFGHQDEVLDVCAGMGERCVSVGGRDRTGRLWKVAEETQLVFRGGGGGGEKKRRKVMQDTEEGNDDEQTVITKSYAEGSIDRVALVDEDTFVTGSDNGSISLWSVHKKKPVFTIPLAHGLDAALKPEEASAETEPIKRRVPERNPRWITALATVAYSDLVVSGSWDGEVRVWRIGEGKKTLEHVGIIGIGRCDDGFETGIRGVVNDISVCERGDRGNQSLCVTVAVGTECRLGRWKRVKGGRSGAVMFEVSRSEDVQKPITT